MPRRSDREPPVTISDRYVGAGLEAEHGAHLVHVEGLALGQVLDDVDEDDLEVVAPRELERARGADVASAHHGHLPTQREPPTCR
jgi:hypothetical protein